MSVSQPSIGLPLQSAHPGAHDDALNMHWPTAQVLAPLTCGRLVQSLLQLPQWRESFGTQPPSQASRPDEHDASVAISATSRERASVESPASTTKASPANASIVASSPAAGDGLGSLQCAQISGGKASARPSCPPASPPSCAVSTEKSGPPQAAPTTPNANTHVQAKSTCKELFFGVIGHLEGEGCELTTSGLARRSTSPVDHVHIAVA